jgi:lipid-A-disaccharide synthase
VSSPGAAIRLAIVAGEESGDILGADLVRALSALSGRPVELVGVGGRHLEALGLQSLFDPAEIALMGLTAVVRDLPNLVRRIGQTARHVVAARPDCLVTIDSPAFNLRVARRVRATAPSLPIVKYVCPSVWAWGAWRAPRMKAFTDHVLCLLPFEPEALSRLGGPPGTFVGHRLSHDERLGRAAARQRERWREAGAKRTLLLLPGSRRSEIAAHLDLFGETVAVLQRRGHHPRLLLPSLPDHRDILERRTAGWPRRPEIVIGEEEKWQAFAEADAALAASGTVTLELALARVPLVSCYRTDLLVRAVMPFLISTWSASLPNLIADRVVVPEYFNGYLHPGRLARHLEALMVEGPMREAQLQGFDRVAEALATDRPAGEIAAGVVLGLIARRSGEGERAAN